MEALDLLLKRVSVARLCEPAPDAEQLDLMFRAALRAPDHGQLRPWRFLTIAGEGRERLGEVFAEAVRQRDAQASDEALEKARRMPLRAPLLVAVIARLQEHPKVPHSEQLLAAGCAAHGLLLAAQALGFGGIWRSGELAFDAQVASRLGLGGDERLLGFIYLGSPEGRVRTAPELDPVDFVSPWPGASS